MLPLNNFAKMLAATKDQMMEDMDEMISAAVLIGGRPNYLTVDEAGFFHLQASGTIDEVLKAMEDQLVKLKRIKQQKEGI